jgi:hypothetical protein
MTTQEKAAILKLKKAGVTATSSKKKKTSKTATLQQQHFRVDKNDQKAPTARVSIPAAVEQAPSISHAIPPDDLRSQSPSLIGQHKQVQLDWQSRVMACGDCVGCTTVHNCDRCQQCILRQYAPSSQQPLLRCMHRICGAPIIIVAHHDDDRRHGRMHSPPYSEEDARSTMSWRAVVSTAKKQETGLLSLPRRPDPPPTTTAEKVEAQATAEPDAGGVRSVVPLTASRGDGGSGTFLARKMQLEP